MKKRRKELGTCLGHLLTKYISKPKLDEQSTSGEDLETNIIEKINPTTFEEGI